MVNNSFINFGRIKLSTMEKVTLITCYIGRSKYIKRILASFLAQDYEGHIELILYHNGYGHHQLSKDILLPPNRTIKMINNHLDYKTNKEYTNTGAIFRDALIHATGEIINFFDSDDLFLPNHTSEGVLGYKRARALNKEAYKPKYSYHVYLDKWSLEENNMEPSIFVRQAYLAITGFGPVSSSYHQQWLSPLQNNQIILVEPKGTPTFLYDWHKGHNTFKISGAGDDSEKNFKNHRIHESSFIEEHTLSPLSKDELNRQYEEITNSSLCNK